MSALGGAAVLAMNWGNLQRLLDSMAEMEAQAAGIDTYFSTTVCDQAGFIGALTSLGNKLPTLGGYFTDTHTMFTKRWEGVTQTVINTGQQYDIADGGVRQALTTYVGDGAVKYRGEAFDFGAKGDGIFTLKDPAAKLTEPEDGVRKLKHNAEFDAVATGFDAVRDKINGLIDKFNSFPGDDLPRLPETSLEEYIIFPLSGDYLAVQKNAGACHNVDAAMAVWASNFSRLIGKSELAFQGRAGKSLVGHLLAYHVVMRAVGEVVGAGSAIFDLIAVSSEKIAIGVENIIVRLSKLLLKLSSKLAGRVAGLPGLIKLAVDFIKSKGQLFNEMIDDVKATIEIIQNCFALVASVQAWADEQAARLERFGALVDAIRALPQASPSDLLTDLIPPAAEAIDNIVETMIPDLEITDKGRGKLEDILGELAETAAGAA